MILSDRPENAGLGKSISSQPNVSVDIKSDYRWICFAFLLFLLQVLPYLSNRWVTDESWYAGPAYSIAHGNGVRDPAIGPNDLENHFDARPPGTALVIAGFFKVFGTTQIPARLGSVFAGLAIVFVTYRLALTLFGQEGAVIACLLVATDNFVVLVSRTARPEALTTMAILLSLLAMQRYRDGSALWAFASGLLIAVGTMFHITVLGYIFSFGILALWIARQKGSSPVLGAIAYVSGFLLGLVPFAVWILTAPLGRLAFQQEYLARAVAETPIIKIIHEERRYGDMFGFNMLHGHGLETFPIRLPIPLFLVIASFLLWKYKRSWFYLELILLIPSLLWFVETANKSSRYISLLAPVFALVVGGALVATRARRTLHTVVLASSCLIIVAQVGANITLLRAAKKADYTKLSAALRSAIPADQTVYGTITFWLAFRDQPFISYERTDPWIAANNYHARYFILGDRMMTQGLDWDSAFYQSMNDHLAEIAARSTVVAHLPDPYYGDLKVYRLDARESASTSISK